MDFKAWLSEVYRRIAIDEGKRYHVYLDSASPPNPTIAIGFNLNRPDASQALTFAGVPAPEIAEVINGTRDLSEREVELLFNYAFAPIIDQARASLQPTHFDSMSDARRFVICDLVYNLGDAGWLGFAGTRALLDQACHADKIGDAATAHALFGQAADHLYASDWRTQVGDRALRDIAMLRSSVWVDANGNGSN